jgi:thymidylate synthase
MYNSNYVYQIRSEFCYLYQNEQFVIDKTGVKTIEIVSASFIADSPTIFGKVNNDYVKRELAWYESQSRNVNDIPGGAPAIWKSVATPEGDINSNYGWCIWSNDNWNQYNNVLNELKNKPNSRRAIMIYTRPSMWEDYNHEGMSDFMCTNAVQYVIRYGKLDAIVQMRSNDVWAGYRNDYAWQSYVLDKLANDLGIRRGYIYWNVGSLHLYSSQFYLLDHYIQTGETSITKKMYDELYGTQKHI